MRWTLKFGLTLGLAFLIAGAAVAAPVVRIDIDGPIGPGVASYVTEAIEEAQGSDAAAILLVMDTPGGLDSAMREIIQAILDSRIPVIGYVAPSGARAASAGTYILMACHVAAMAPGTTIGAATPIAMGGGMPGTPDPSDPNGDTSKPQHPDIQDKIISDSAAYMRALAEMRGRPADKVEKFVTDAISISDSEALAEGIIEISASSVRALLMEADGRIIRVDDREWTLETMKSDINRAEPTWRDDFLAFITNPNIAYLLLLIGIYGLIFEFSNPGLILPGVTGAIALVLGLYALHLLPVNYAGLALLVIGLALIVAEAFAPSFGVLGISGVIAFVLGSVLLLDTDVPGFQISKYLIGSVALVTSAIALLFMTLAVRAWRRPVVSGAEAMLGLKGRVLDWHGFEGNIRTHGEIWAARSDLPLKKDEIVHVTGMEGLVLQVDRLPEEEL